MRNPGNIKKVGHLDKITKTSSEKIEYFKSDLLENGTYVEAIKGCELVYHAASPFTSKIKDPQAKFVDPALLSTRFR